jgi:Na+/melibiose symporter-like transporter
MIDENFDKISSTCVIIFSSQFVLLYSLAAIAVCKNFRVPKFFFNTYALLASVMLLIFFAFCSEDIAVIFFVFCIIVCAVCHILVWSCLTMVPNHNTNRRNRGNEDTRKILDFHD